MPTWGLPTRGLVSSWTGQVTDWTARGQSSHGLNKWGTGQWMTPLAENDTTFS